MNDEMQPESAPEGRSLDLVQRTLVSLLAGGVIAMVAVVLALYVSTRGPGDLPRDSVVGLWVLTGVIGLAGAATVLVLNRRKAWNPLVLVGLGPMVIAAYWVFMPTVG